MIPFSLFQNSSFRALRSASDILLLPFNSEFVPSVGVLLSLSSPRLPQSTASLLPCLPPCTASESALGSTPPTRRPPPRSPRRSLWRCPAVRGGRATWPRTWPSTCACSASSPPRATSPSGASSDTTESESSDFDFLDRSKCSLPSYFRRLLLPRYLEGA